MNAGEIFELLKTAVDMFYTHDKASAPERSCVFRIGAYMQCMLESQPDELCVDCEYGNATGDTKNELIKQMDSNGAFVGSKGQKGRIYPDLIVHKRGAHTHNMLVVEFKGYWNNTNWTKDEAKLKALTTECSHINIKKYFNYQLGVFVALGKTEEHFVCFQGGRQVSAGDSVADLFKKRSDL